jgi:molybdopterin synthase catalytic subunit
VTIKIIDHRFDPWRMLSEEQDTLNAGKYGATAVFVGTMRDFNEDRPVTTMELEHYQGMTETHLERVATEAEQRWDLDDVLIVHRVGSVRPGEPIVLVAAWSAHRAAAFDACRYIMEDLKSRAPFWKKESLVDGGDRWVEYNTPG